MMYHIPTYIHHKRVPICRGKSSVWVACCGMQNDFGYDAQWCDGLVIGAFFFVEWMKVSFFVENEHHSRAHHLSIILKLDHFL